jgi:hypothetical protein
MNWIGTYSFLSIKNIISDVLEEEIQFVTGHREIFLF